MPKIKYIDRNFSADSLAIIIKANAIIEEYLAQGFELTLRQLYYQFVARGLIENTQKQYKRLGNIINNGRLAGYIDWDSIIDRTRNLNSFPAWNSPGDIINRCVDSYRIDKWQNQRARLEVWIEKDALMGVVADICNELEVPYFSCRGYCSQSEMWGASQRFLGYLSKGKSIVLIHLGDHDPSGIDMTRDISERISLFFSSEMLGFPVHRIALNFDQVQMYSPPPNPAKETDSRAHGYIKKFGVNSWELDALEPKIIVDLIHNEVLKWRDPEKWEAMVEREESERAVLEEIYNNL